MNKKIKQYISILLILSLTISIVLNYMPSVSKANDTTEFTELTFSDIGMDGTIENSVFDAKISTWDNIALIGNVTFGLTEWDTVLVVGGIGTKDWFGINLAPTNDGLYITSPMCDSTGTTGYTIKIGDSTDLLIDNNAFGGESLLGKTVKLRLTFTYTDTGITMGVTIDDKFIQDVNFGVSQEDESINCKDIIGSYVLGYNITVASEANDTPVNSDIYEDFEKEAINDNLLTARITEACQNYAPTKMTIEEIDGSRALLYRNAATTYIGTQYKYANFEMTFDVVYMQREDVTDENGDILIPKSDTMAISLGDESADYEVGTYGYTTSTDTIAFVTGDSGIYSLNNGHSAAAADSGYDFGSSTCENDFSIKVSMINSVVTVGIKWIEEENFTEVLTYTRESGTPLGHVHIWTIGTNANFAIDNLSIVNKDENPRLVDVYYKSALIEKPDDFAYQSSAVEDSTQEGSSITETDMDSSQILKGSTLTLDGSLKLNVVAELPESIRKDNQLTFSDFGEGPVDGVMTGMSKCNADYTSWDGLTLSGNITFGGDGKYFILGSADSEDMEWLGIQIYTSAEAGGLVINCCANPEGCTPLVDGWTTDPIVITSTDAGDVDFQTETIQLSLSFEYKDVGMYMTIDINDIYTQTVDIGIAESESGTKYDIKDYLEMNLYFYEPLAVEPIQETMTLSSGYMSFEMSSGEVQRASVRDAVSVPEYGENHYMFTCDVAARQMADDITVTYHCGDWTSESQQYSVKKYAETIIANENNEYATRITNLAKNLLDYGTASQKYFNYNTNNLANTEFVGSELNVTADMLEAYAKGVQSNEQIAALTSTSLRLQSETTLRMYFTFADGVSGDNFNFTDEEGNILEVVWTGNRYYVDFENIKAHELDKDYTVTITDGNELSQTYSYSVLSYCYAALNYEKSSEKLQNLAKAIYLYNLAAERYMIDPNAVWFDFIGGKDVMPIAGYWGPYVAQNGEDAQSPPDYNSDEFWKAIAESGVNLVSFSNMNYANYPQEVIKSLKYGEKYGVATVVQDGRILDMASQENISSSDVAERISNYENYRAFAGLYLVDEPGTSYFSASEDEKAMLDYYLNLAPMLNQDMGMFTYTNAHSSGLGTSMMQNYETYINDFCDTLKPKYLMFDRYPFDKIQEGHLDRFFYDLSIVRKTAQDKNIPFWTFVQAGSQWNDVEERFDSNGYYPSEGEFDWNVNISLAFGAKGINYFPLIQPYEFSYAKSTPFDFERNGLFGAWGNKNRWYYYAQDVNKQIKAVDEVLMYSENQGILACCEQAKTDMKLTQDYNVLIEDTGWRELKSVQGEAVVGCFDYLGKTALYVVNYSTDSPNTIELKFTDTYDVTVIQNTKTQNLHESGMTIDMLPGEGVLVVFE